MKHRNRMALRQLHVEGELRRVVEKGLWRQSTALTLFFIKSQLGIRSQRAGIAARIRTLPDSFNPSLNPTLSSHTDQSDDGLKIPIPGRTRWCFFNIRYVDPSLEPRQGYLWHSTSPNRPRIRCPPSHHDSRTFLPAQRERTANSRCIGHGGQRSGLHRPRTGLR